MKSSKYKVWEPLLLAMVAVIGMIAGSKMADRSHGHNQGNSGSNSGQISEIIRFAEEQYVDDVNSGELIEKAIEAILGELDPHSGYFTPEELVSINEKMDGHFDGIGVQFHVLRDTITVLFVNEDGPASKAGILPHDRIVSADGVSMIAVDNKTEDIVKQLRGKKGSEVNVLVYREGVDSLITVPIVRDEIAIKSVAAAYMLNDNTAYIKVSHFSSTTYREFMSSVEDLVENEKAEHLVFDLRGNPGGYLKEAVNILSQLFEQKDELLVYTEGVHAQRMEYNSTGKPFYHIENIVVLIDGGSASASEIIAGAIQDHDRGVILGSRSYGKGLVQEQFPLNNGGALRLTVARYYTPSGRCIQTPYNVEPAYVDTTGMHEDSVVFKTTNGRVVEAEGGIAPDIEVPAKFNWYSENAYVTYNQMIEYMFYGFEDSYADNYSTVEAYLNAFQSSSDMKDDFKEFLSLGTEDLDYLKLEKDWDRVYTMLKAMAVSYRFDHEAWYRVVNMEDPVVTKALEIVKEDTRTTLKI